MELDSAPVTTASDAARALEGQARQYTRPSRKISLAGIRPWTWFVIDYAIAYACATLAFISTPYAGTLNVLEQEHVGQFGFSLGLALLVALIAHVAGLHELIRGVDLLGCSHVVSLCR